MESLFSRILSVIPREGLTLTFTPDNVAEGDRFLIFSAWKSHTCQFVRSRNGLIYVLFDHDDAMLLEECPESFYRTILKVAEEEKKIA